MLRERTPYAAKSVIRSKYPLTVRISAPGQTDVRYFLERNDKTRTQFITVRGSANSTNFSEDFDIAVREDRKANIPVHAGFDLAARAIYDDVRPYLKTGYKTYLAGHSLGGAIAAILTIYMIEDTFRIARAMSALGQRQTYAAQQVMSALLPIATTKAGICASSCPLYPQKRTCAAQVAMSAMGQKRTLACFPPAPFADGLSSLGWGNILIHAE